MATDSLFGAEGYAEKADDLRVSWEKVSFAEKHRPVMHLIPLSPGWVLDIGSGSGADAAAFAEMGHDVVAVEPVDELRLPASVVHPSPRIKWLKDGLPDLASVTALDKTFDLVMLTAVWMHLDPSQRRKAMFVIAKLTREGGLVIMTLRHGPIPAKRRMFDVAGSETRDLAVMHGLECVLERESQSAQLANRLSGVTWTHLALRRSLRAANCTSPLAIR